MGGGRARGRAVGVVAQDPSSSSSSASFSERFPTSRLPLFVLPRIQFPATKGTLNVYESRYVAMFEELSKGPAEGRRFGHIAAMDSRDSGTVAYGVECRCIRMVRTGSKPSDGSQPPALVVSYESGQRFRLVRRADDGGADRERGLSAWPVGDVVWVRDAPIKLQEFPSVMRLEQELWMLLMSVSELTERLHEGKPSVLPATLRSLSPPGARGKLEEGVLQGVDKTQLSNSDPRLRNRATHDAMTMWAASGSKGTLESTHGDCTRQELFSFAVSSLIDTTVLDEDSWKRIEGLGAERSEDGEGRGEGEGRDEEESRGEEVQGVPQLWESDEVLGLTGEAAVRHAVLALLDTRTRLEWAKASILPHLRHLEAQLAVAQALGEA